MTCTAVSTIHAAGDANSPLSSFASIVNIIGSLRAASGRGFFVVDRTARRPGRSSSCRQVDEYVFEAGLRRRELIEAPVVLHCALHEMLRRIAIGGELQAK